MRLGGFVIHGNNRSSLGRCLDSLAAVSEECVAVDTGSTDGSARLVRRSGFRRIPRRWEGYGAARAAAAAALPNCDYLFFLDSDEWLEPAAIVALRAWKGSGPTAPHYALRRNDWARLLGRRFLYRTEHHVRLIHRGAAGWQRDMIVHEALPAAPTRRLDITFEHHFAEDLGVVRTKFERYALLWAIRNVKERRPVKPALLQRLAHFLRDAICKGAAFRGGLPACQLADTVAWHHARKYELLREVRSGAYPELVRAFEENRLADLFDLLSTHRPKRLPHRAPSAVARVRSSAHLAGASLGVRSSD
ncbi:MAG TPA: glycosyltransferase family 2 protein [Anaeromyxobacter sp.]|nr:glycosyltransferase family 2 protein [Anaeromyxobacter sp.]